MNKRTIIAATLGAAFLACILLANYVTTRYGMIPVGFGLVATAGTYLAGVTFVLRDSIQDAVRAYLTREIRGRGHMAGVIEIEEPKDWRVTLPIFGLIVLGAGLSYLIASPFIALASGVAFLASETADLVVYTPLRERGYVRAAIASNVVGALVDTVLFLWVAGFPIAGAVAGQMVGKLTVTAVTVALVLGVRGALLRQSVDTSGA
jgi:uncharacterized PurR-regulated membrane protein YhhQ (DUF165 family)